MNELLALFEGSIHTLSTALGELERMENRCRALEALLQEASDFLILLDTGALSEQQISERQALLDRIWHLLNREEVPCVIES